MKHTMVLGGSQFTRCIPLSKRVAKIKKSGRISCVRPGYFASKSWRQIWWCANQPFKYFFITSEVNSTMRRCFFNHTDLGQNLFFFALFKPIILQFFTILQDKLHSFNIQDDQSTRFLCTTNYSIDHIIKRFDEENYIMQELFIYKNLVLCDMQGNNYGLLAKTIKNSQNRPFGPPDGFSLLTTIN